MAWSGRELEVATDAAIKSARDCGDKIAKGVTRASDEITRAFGTPGN